MADLQAQFMKFHDTIKIDFDGNEPLRAKRDIILNALKTGIKNKYPKLTFSTFNQGSYDMATGVEPLGEDDYDIDIGIVLNISQTNNCPIKVKKAVYDILNAAYQRNVEFKKPCIRVQYHKAGEKAYHVDLAIYSKGMNRSGDLNDDLYIAKGKQHSTKENQFWEISEPYQLKELIRSKFSELTDKDQFRRIIRYLKRWKDFNSAFIGAGKPSGISITACCYKWFSVQKTYIYYTRAFTYNDLDCLRHIVNSILNKFNENNRIAVRLPVKPKNNLFERMTDIQMLVFREQLKILKDTLAIASNSSETTMACMQLRRVFGSDFPKS